MFRCLLFLVAVVSSTACHVENMGNGGMVPDFTKASRDTVCSAFCNQLFTCGTIEPQAYDGCIGTCHAHFDSDESSTRTGCKCVTEAACQSSATSKCKGAPMPGTPVTTGSASSSIDAGSSAADAGSSRSGGGDAGSTVTPRKSGAYSCGKNADCAWSEDCIGGLCEVRCKASCECHNAESCVNNYCVAAVAPPKACVTDCECPSGGKCLANTCH